MTDKKTFLLRIFTSAALCVALLFALMEMSNPSLTEVDAAPKSYLGFAMLGLAVSELLSFVYLRRTDPSRWHYCRLGYAAVLVVAMVFAFAVSSASRLYVIAPAVYFVVPIAKRIIAIARKRKARARLYNILVLIVCILALLATFALCGTLKENYHACSIFANLVIMFTCLLNICAMVFSQFNKEILLRIVSKTYAGEIVLGLFLLVVAFSLVLMHNEESVHTFGDAVWYCFAVVTTIGFGDIAAVTTVGRILTVILGLYGIVVVAILTSIIVNFYSEVKDKPDDAPAPIDDSNVGDEDAPQEESESAAPAEEFAAPTEEAPTAEAPQPDPDVPDGE